MPVAIAGKCPFCGAGTLYTINGVGETKCSNCGAEYYYTSTKLTHFKTNQFWFTRKDKNNEKHDDDAEIDKLVAETNARITARESRM